MLAVIVVQHGCILDPLQIDAGHYRLGKHQYDGHEQDESMHAKLYQKRFKSVAQCNLHSASFQYVAAKPLTLFFKRGNMIYT